jgi:hypothetical protein
VYAHSLHIVSHSDRTATISSKRNDAIRHYKVLECRCHSLLVHALSVKQPQPTKRSHSSSRARLTLTCRRGGRGWWWSRPCENKCTPPACSYTACGRRKDGLWHLFARIDLQCVICIVQLHWRNTGHEQIHTDCLRPWGLPPPVTLQCNSKYADTQASS